MSQCEQQYNEDRSRALAAIYQEYDGFIQSIIRYSAKNKADQEDIYQEVFLVLFQKADFSEIQDFKSYLYRLVVNKSNEFLRRKITQELRLKTYMELQSQDAVEEGQDEELLVLDEVDGMLELMQDRLSQRESEAIRLRFKYHYSNEDAAQKMNVQKETLIRYVSVGLKKIREILKSIGKS
jgi:RNA polymerase sigma-70 factor (ECF subfamily)